MLCWPLDLSDSALTVEVSVAVEVTMVELTLGQWSSRGLGVRHQLNDGVATTRSHSL